ncbi:MAG: hypothetical protein IPO51_14925 [Dehalococcoidia bacterium]|nr:hypothetical protein [Dehalococcoidia bacterium]
MNAVEDHDPLAASSAGYPDAAVSVAFFAAMFGHETTGRMTIWTASNRKTYWPNTTAEAAAAAIGLAGDDDVYFGVGLRRSRLMNGRGSSDEVGSVTAVWADVDIEGPGHAAGNYPPDEAAARLLLSEFPLPVSIVVHSGGGLHAYWLLAEPIQGAEAAQLVDSVQKQLRALADSHGWKIDTTSDLARVLRSSGNDQSQEWPTAPSAHARPA